MMQSDSMRVLEPHQLAAARADVLPRRRLGRGMTALLVALRVYVLLAVALVGYALMRALVAPQ